MHRSPAWDVPGCIGPKDISLAVSKPSGSAFGVNYSSSGAGTRFYADTNAAGSPIQVSLSNPLPATVSVCKASDWYCSFVTGSWPGDHAQYGSIKFHASEHTHLTYAASGVTLVPDLWLHYLQMDFVARKVGCTGSFWDAYYNRLCADGAIWLDTTPPGFGPSSGALTGTASLGGYSQRFPSGFWAHDRYAWFRVHANFGGDNIDFQAGGSGSASCPTGTTLGETKYFASNGSRYRFMTSALCGSLGEYPLPDGT